MPIEGKFHGGLGDVHSVRSTIKLIAQISEHRKIIDCNQTSHYDLGSQ
jgi:hypothetical protein